MSHYARRSLRRSGRQLALLGLVIVFGLVFLVVLKVLGVYDT
jgi:lipopolysaccharide export LptBFGC system permease protein LptF